MDSAETKAGKRCVKVVRFKDTAASDRQTDAKNPNELPSGASVRNAPEERDPNDGISSDQERLLRSEQALEQTTIVAKTDTLEYQSGDDDFLISEDELELAEESPSDTVIGDDPKQEIISGELSGVLEYIGPDELKEKVISQSSTNSATPIGAVVTKPIPESVHECLKQIMVTLGEKLNEIMFDYDNLMNIIGAIYSGYTGDILSPLVELLGISYDFGTKSPDLYTENEKYIYGLVNSIPDPILVPVVKETLRAASQLMSRSVLSIFQNLINAPMKLIEEIVDLHSQVNLASRPRGSGEMTHSERFKVVIELNRESEAWRKYLDALIEYHARVIVPMSGPNRILEFSPGGANLSIDTVWAFLEARYKVYKPNVYETIDDLTSMGPDDPLRLAREVTLACKNLYLSDPSNFADNGLKYIQENGYRVNGVVNNRLFVDKLLSTMQKVLNPPQIAIWYLHENKEKKLDLSESELDEQYRAKALFQVFKYADETPPSSPPGKGYDYFGRFSVPCTCKAMEVNSFESGSVQRAFFNLVQMENQKAKGGPLADLETGDMEFEDKIFQSKLMNDYILSDPGENDLSFKACLDVLFPLTEHRMALNIPNKIVSQFMTGFVSAETGSKAIQYKINDGRGFSFDMIRSISNTFFKTIGLDGGSDKHNKKAIIMPAISRDSLLCYKLSTAHSIGNLGINGSAYHLLMNSRPEDMDEERIKTEVFCKFDFPPKDFTEWIELERVESECQDIRQRINSFPISIAARKFQSHPFFPLLLSGMVSAAAADSTSQDGQKDNSALESLMSKYLPHMLDIHSAPNGARISRIVESIMFADSDETEACIEINGNARSCLVMNYGFPIGMTSGNYYKGILSRPFPSEGRPLREGFQPTNANIKRSGWLDRNTKLLDETRVEIEKLIEEFALRLGRGPIRLLGTPAAFEPPSQSRSPLSKQAEEAMEALSDDNGKSAAAAKPIPPKNLTPTDFNDLIKILDQFVYGFIPGKPDPPQIDLADSEALKIGKLIRACRDGTVPLIFDTFDPTSNDDRELYCWLMVEIVRRMVVHLIMNHVDLDEIDIILNWKKYLTSSPLYPIGRLRSLLSHVSSETRERYDFDEAGIIGFGVNIEFIDALVIYLDVVGKRKSGDPNFNYDNEMDEIEIRRLLSALPLLSEISEYRQSMWGAYLSRLGDFLSTTQGQKRLALLISFFGTMFANKISDPTSDKDEKEIDYKKGVLNYVPPAADSTDTNATMSILDPEVAFRVNNDKLPDIPQSGEPFSRISQLIVKFINPEGPGIVSSVYNKYLELFAKSPPSEFLDRVSKYPRSDDEQGVLYGLWANLYKVVKEIQVAGEENKLGNAAVNKQLSEVLGPLTSMKASDTNESDAAKEAVDTVLKEAIKIGIRMINQTTQSNLLNKLIPDSVVKDASKKLPIALELLGVESFVFDERKNASSISSTNSELMDSAAKSFRDPVHNKSKEILTIAHNEIKGQGAVSAAFSYTTSLFSNARNLSNAIRGMSIKDSDTYLKYGKPIAGFLTPFVKGALTIGTVASLSYSLIRFATGPYANKLPVFLRSQFGNYVHMDNDKSTGLNPQKITVPSILLEADSVEKLFSQQLNTDNVNNVRKLITCANGGSLRVELLNVAVRNTFKTWTGVGEFLTGTTLRVGTTFGSAYLYAQCITNQFVPLVTSYASSLSSNNIYVSIVAYMVVIAMACYLRYIATATGERAYNLIWESFGLKKLFRQLDTSYATKMKAQLDVYLQKQSKR